MTITRRTHAVALAGTAGALTFAGALTIGAGTQPADAAYHTPWSRDDAYTVGETGLLESYQFAHSQWTDDDAWNEIGADCSGYAGKVFAAPAWTAITTDYSYPYTGTWYANGVDGSINVALDYSATRKMDTYVYRVSSGGSSDHMGLYEGTTNASGQWKIWNAASEGSGIVSGFKADSFFTDNNAKRFKRANW